MKPANLVEIPLELKIIVRPFLTKPVVKELNLPRTLLKILEYLDGDAILTLWQASSELHRLLKQDYGLKFWNLIRRESGFSVPDAPQLPTDDELRIMLYVVDWYCQVSLII